MGRTWKPPRKKLEGNSHLFRNRGASDPPILSSNKEKNKHTVLLVKGKGMVKPRSTSHLREKNPVLPPFRPPSAPSRSRLSFAREGK